MIVITMTLSYKTCMNIESTYDNSERGRRCLAAGVFNKYVCIFNCIYKHIYKDIYI